MLNRKESKIFKNLHWVPSSIHHSKLIPGISSSGKPLSSKNYFKRHFSVKRYVVTRMTLSRKHNISSSEQLQMKICESKICPVKCLKANVFFCPVSVVCKLLFFKSSKCKVILYYFSLQLCLSVLLAPFSNSLLLGSSGF